MIIYPGGTHWKNALRLAKIENPRHEPMACTPDRSLLIAGNPDKDRFDVTIKDGPGINATIWMNQCTTQIQAYLIAWGVDENGFAPVVGEVC